MWATIHALIDAGRVEHYRLTSDGEVLSYAAVLSMWREDAKFRSFFSRTLAACPFPAYRWETPPLTCTTVERDFECVLLRSDLLARPVDHGAFREHFEVSGSRSVATFGNLSGDAVMVVPCPVAQHDIYGHLASFVRQAPADQIQDLWTAVAVAMNERLSAKPVWLSTAGMGVSWLHVRLDSRPKYYGYAPFRELT